MLREQKERLKVVFSLMLFLVFIFAAICGGYHLVTGRPVIINGQKNETMTIAGFAGSGAQIESGTNNKLRRVFEHEEYIFPEYVIDIETPEGFWIAEDFVINTEKDNVMTCIATGITFGDNVGRILWEEGVMIFEGNIEESAKIFFEKFLKPMIDKYIEDELEKEQLAIEVPEQIMYRFDTSFDYPTYQPEWFLQVVNTDMSKCFINNRLRLDLNGEIYWIRLEVTNESTDSEIRYLERKVDWLERLIYSINNDMMNIKYDLIEDLQRQIADIREIVQFIVRKNSECFDESEKIYIFGNVTKVIEDGN